MGGSETKRVSGSDGATGGIPNEKGIGNFRGSRSGLVRPPVTGRRTRPAKITSFSQILLCVMDATTKPYPSPPCLPPPLAPLAPPCPPPPKARCPFFSSSPTPPASSPWRLCWFDVGCLALFTYPFIVINHACLGKLIATIVLPYCKRQSLKLCITCRQRGTRVCHTNCIFQNEKKINSMRKIYHMKLLFFFFFFIQ